MIDERRIKENLELFSFPRLCGTSGEKKAFNLALEKIKNFNLKYDIQEFTFSTYFGKYYPKILISICYFLLFSFYINLSAIIFPILFLISYIILLIHLILAKRPEKIKLGKKLKSQNLIINLPYQISDKDSIINKSERNILFFCHLDSKSQKISILARIRAARAWVFSSIALLIIIILKNYILNQISLIFFIIGAIPLAVSTLATILIIINTTGNNSRGAIDNASGIGCVMELLNHYLDPKLRLTNFNLWFIFTGAEECGTMGIRHFFQKIKEIDRNNTIILNFDSIARSIYFFPGKPINKNVELLLQKFLNNSKKLDIKVFSKRFYIGSRSDAYFLKKKGFKGIGIGDMESYKFIHSVNDTLDKVNPSILKDLCEIVITILRDYDTNFNIT
ncbi:MAG: M28 family metallopeptidase [Candidatus Hodarchaeota archaeon]